MVYMGVYHLKPNYCGVLSTLMHLKPNYCGIKNPIFVVSLFSRLLLCTVYT